MRNQATHTNQAASGLVRLPTTEAAGLAHCQYASPLGQLTLLASASQLIAIRFEAPPGILPIDLPGAPRDNHPVLTRTREALSAYFSGTLRQFSLPLLLQSGTPFQQQAWKALRAIPYGETRTYSEQAAVMGHPSACRAVGAANHRNLFPIVVPCHRVIGKNLTLTGYAGGLAAKRFLLELEQRYK
jgi:methylated-DNA-[protein]-cysteine S-methyltransferase